LALLLFFTMVRPWDRLRHLLGVGAGAAAAGDGLGQDGTPDVGDTQQLDPPGGDTEGPP
jgi:hypothetical protein